MLYLLIEIAKASLVRAMQHLIKAVASGPAQPSIQSVHIRADSEGITLTTSNSHMTVQMNLPRDQGFITVKRPGSIVVPAHYFYNILRKLDDKTITLEIKEPLILTIVLDHFQMRLCGMDDLGFAVPGYEKEADAAKFRIDCALFRSAIKQVAGAASTSEDRPVLTGVLLEGDQGKLHVTAADGIRLSSRTLYVESQANPGFKAIIPAKNVSDISKMLEQEGTAADVEVGHGRIRFVAGSMKIESALIQGTFPSVKSLNTESSCCEFIVARANLLKAVEGVTIMAGENIIRLEVKGVRMHLSARAAAIGDVENEVPVQVIGGEGFVLSLNGKLLIDILRSSDYEYLRIKYAGSIAPLVIRPDDSLESMLFLITSVRTPESFSKKNER